MLKKIGLGLIVLLVGFAGFVATRPSEFQIMRSRTVAAPPETVFAYLNDFHKWPEWSPWEKMDLAMKKEFSGEAVGPGSVYAWAGNDKVGEGRMTITGSQPGKSVTIQLDFIKPWTATNMTQFDLAPNGAGTAVAWTMTGHNNFMAKAFCLFMDMDKMVGADFERGLENLDAATAAAAVPVSETK